MCRRPAEDGFTLTELIVVMGMLGMILAVAYAGFNVAANGSDLSNQQSMMSREIGAPLEFADRVLTQTFEFDTEYPGITPYRCAFYVDQDNDGFRERYVIEVSGSRLLVTSEEEGARARNRVAWSESNVNIAEAEPLFRYYDAVGAEISDMTEVEEDVKSVLITIAVGYDDKILQDSRTIFLRNR